MDNRSVFMSSIAGPAGDRLPLERDPSLQELAQFRGRLELGNGGEFLERGCERIRETPDGSRPEFFVLRLEVQVVCTVRARCFGASSLPSTKAS
jgi:hypothetical protein